MPTTEFVMPRHGLVDRHARPDRSPLANVIVDIAPAPVGEIMIALIVAHSAMIVTNSAQHGFEAIEIVRERRRQHHLAKRHAIERVVANDKTLGLMRPSD